MYRTQQLELKDPQIVCWANIPRQGEAMDVHAHGGTPIHSSGNMHFDDYPNKNIL